MSVTLCFVAFKCSPEVTDSASPMLTTNAFGLYFTGRHCCWDQIRKAVIGTGKRSEGSWCHAWLVGPYFHSPFRLLVCLTIEVEAPDISAFYVRCGCSSLRKQWRMVEIPIFYQDRSATPHAPRDSRQASPGL